MPCVHGPLDALSPRRGGDVRQSLRRPSSAERSLRSPVQQAPRPLRPCLRGALFRPESSRARTTSTTRARTSCRTPSRPGLCDAPEEWPWSSRPLCHLAGDPAFLRQEEAVPRAVRAAEPDQQRDARERPTLPDAAVLEHGRLPVVDGVARARRPRRYRDPWRGRSSRVRSGRRGSGRRPDRMSQRSVTGPKPVE